MPNSNVSPDVPDEAGLLCEKASLRLRSGLWLVELFSRLALYPHLQASANVLTSGSSDSVPTPSSKKCATLTFYSQCCALSLSEIF